MDAKTAAARAYASMAPIPSLASLLSTVIAASVFAGIVRQAQELASGRL